MLLSGMDNTDNAKNGAAVGLCAELQVAAAFARTAVPCVPLRPARFDLVVVQQGQLFRIQVKRAQWEEARHNKRGWHDRAHWQVGLVSGSNRNGTRQMKPYALTDFDYLAVVCAVDRVYVIPVDMLRSPKDPTTLMRSLHIKPYTEDSTSRHDSWMGAAKWEPYRNRFDLLGPLGEVPPYVKTRPVRERKKPGTPAVKET